MAPNLAHFALNADDVDTDRTFYESVFGWAFEPWGPPGFFRIRTGPADDPGVPGALQQRRTLDGVAAAGVEATFAVDDVDETARRVVASGGAVVMPRFTIAGVGHLIFLTGPSGTAIGAMQYDDAAR